MKQLSFAIPISKVVVLGDLKRRCQLWGVPQSASALLEQWYEDGWDDGIAAFDRYTLAQALGVGSTELNENIALLEDLQLIQLRRGLSHEVAELLALSSAHHSDSLYLGWWQVYRLELEGHDD
jgi:hypothetical protein